MSPSERTDLAPTAPWPRWLLVLMGTAAATITIAGMRGVAELLGPVFLALVLVVAVHPLRGWLERRKVPGWVATLLITVTVYVFLLGFALALVVSAAEFAALLPKYADQLTDTIDKATAWLKGLGVDTSSTETISGSLDVGKLADAVEGVLSSLASVFSGLFLVVTLLLFLAIDGAWFPHRLNGLNEGETHRRPLVSSLATFARKTRRYLVVSTVFGLIVAIIDTGALWLMGIPAPLLWGLLAFITNYIPNIGFIIGLVPVAVLGLLEGGWELMLAVIAVYCVINVVIQSVIQPKVVGDAVGLSASLTFISLIFWAWVLGALGALLAIPISLLVKSLLVDIDPSSEWLQPLLGNADDPAAEATG